MAIKRKTYPIDWRHEIASLQPFIDGQGGVVRINYANNGCAPNAFVETLTSLYEGMLTATSICSQSLRIDPHNYRIRYLPEIRKEFMRKMGLELPVPRTNGQSSGKSHISSNNTAVGDQTIETNIYYSDSDVSLRERRDEWIEALCNQLKQYLIKSNRFMVIIMDGSAEDQQEFWDSLWHGGMSGLVDHGLLLVRMVDNSNAVPYEHQRAAQPDCEISLPVDLNSEQQNHAIEDIANWIIRWIPKYKENEARLLATGYVVEHTGDRNKLHNAGLWLMKLKQRVG